MEETNQSVIDFLISIGKENILPIFDFLYIGIILTGSTVMFKLFPKWKPLNSNKFRSVFIFAMIVSFFYVGIDVMLGLIEDPKPKLILNVFNWFFAVIIYHVFVKTIVRIYVFLSDKFLGTTNGKTTPKK